MSKSELNKTRQALVDEFISCLQEDNLPWRRGWKISGIQKMYNPVTKTVYKGINAFYLNLIAIQRGYDDPRWCTFNQAKQKGWNVIKGSKGVHIEYWSIYDKLQKKNISIQEARDIIAKDKDRQEDLVWRHRDFSVFNASCIDGIEKLPEPENNKLTDVQMDKLIDNIIKNMDVGYREFGDEAYYTPALDIVTMPPKVSFFNEYEFNSTLLHELAHATGHESRLNRDIQNTFGSMDYAVEELRAEITSAFMSQYCDLSMTPEHLENHKAYVQSWAQKIKDDPNILFKAIKDAEEISDYMIEQGELEKIKEESFIHPSIDKQILHGAAISSQVNALSRQPNHDKEEMDYTI